MPLGPGLDGFISSFPSASLGPGLDDFIQAIPSASMGPGVDGFIKTIPSAALGPGVDGLVLTLGPLPPTISSSGLRPRFFLRNRRFDLPGPIST